LVSKRLIVIRKMLGIKTIKYVEKIFRKNNEILSAIAAPSFLPSRIMPGTD
jgi:hypothetical protein